MTIAGRFSPMGGIPDRVFRATFVITAGETLSINCNDNQFGYPVDVEWGDGTSQTYPTGVVMSSITHTYTNAGEYQVCIKTGTGKAPRLSFRGLTSLKRVDHSHVQWLITTTERTDVGAMFRECGVESVPSSLFKYNPNITTLSGVFYSANKLNVVPEHLFDEQKVVTNCSSVFYYTPSLQSVPNNIFKYQWNATAYQSTFHSARITSIPEGIFDNSPNVTNFLSVFRNALNITSIPQDIFKYNTKVKNFSYAFYQCTKIEGTLQADLFSHAASTVENLAYAFAGCTSLTGTIPSGFLDGFVKLTNLTQTFFNCNKLTSAPSLLFKDCSVATNFTQCFASCAKMTIPSDLFCASSAKTTRFASVTPNFDGCFNRSSWTGSVAGTAPDLWNYTFGGTPTTTNCYGGTGNSATSLTNYSSIPSAWKS